MWWHLPPAMLKGWFDRVLAYGAAYTSSKRFLENGRFVGKRAMLSVTVGTSRETYMHDGRSGDIKLHALARKLHPRLCGLHSCWSRCRLWRGGANLYSILPSSRRA